MDQLEISHLNPCMYQKSELGQELEMLWAGGVWSSALCMQSQAGLDGALLGTWAPCITHCFMPAWTSCHPSLVHGPFFQLVCTNCHPLASFLSLCCFTESHYNYTARINQLLFRDKALFLYCGQAFTRVDIKWIDNYVLRKQIIAYN